MSRPSTVPKTDPSPRSAPSSDVRPRRPSPSADEHAEQCAAAYARLRVEQEDLVARIKEAGENLAAVMRRAGKSRISTADGTVALLAPTEPRLVLDEKRALELLSENGLPEPATLERWLGRHGIPIPRTTKPGLPERISFARAG